MPRVTKQMYDNERLRGLHKRRPGLYEGRVESVEERPQLRDQFAAAALTGVLAMQKASFYPSDVASYAYEIADAMLAAREVK